MPIIYGSQGLKARPRVRLFIVLFMTMIFINYGMRLFHLRFGIVPFEQYYRADFRGSEADFERAMGWFEFFLIVVASQVFAAMIILWIFIRECAWRLWVRPSVRLVSFRNLALAVFAVATAFYAVFLCLNPEAARGTRAAGPLAFTGALATGAVLLSSMNAILLWLRPQDTDLELWIRLWE